MLAISKGVAVVDAPYWPQDGRKQAYIMEFAAKPVARDDFMKRRLDALIATLKAVDSVWVRK